MPARRLLFLAAGVVRISTQSSMGFGNDEAARGASPKFSKYE